MSRRRVIILWGLGVALILTGCASRAEAPTGASPTAGVTPGPVQADGEAVASPAPSPSQTPQATSQPAVDHAVSVVIATAGGASVDVFDQPDGNVVTTVNAADVLTNPTVTPLVFLVERVEDEWLLVYLPIRPNGSTGWVLAADVTLATTDMRVEVSLADFSLEVWHGEELVFQAPVAVGRSDRPTPGGVYYIRELVQPADPDGVYGPYAYGLSGFSQVLDSFGGGDAVIGLHGTNEPDSIGTTVSSGCLRMLNEDLITLVTEVGLSLGTPVYLSE